MPRRHYQRVRAIVPDVLLAVAGVCPGQGAKHQPPHHETNVGSGFAGCDELVHLVGLGEVMVRLGRGVRGWIATDNFSNRCQVVVWLHVSDSLTHRDITGGFVLRGEKSVPIAGRRPSDYVITQLCCYALTHTRDCGILIS